MGPERAGQLAHVWADEFTVHVLIGGQLVKTVPSSLDAEDLATLKMRGASPAGPPPAAPSPAKAGALPGDTVIEVDRSVDANGVVDLAGHQVKADAELARRRVTLRLDGHLSTSSATASWPRPCPALSRPLTGPSYAAPTSPRPRCRRQLPVRSASSARSPATASSWSPASGCASAPPTPGRSSPSTSRTPTSASPATAPRSPCTRDRAAPRHPVESQDPRPESRGHVQHLLSLSAMW